jgi:hypothetical protein
MFEAMANHSGEKVGLCLLSNSRSIPKPTSSLTQPLTILKLSERSKRSVGVFGSMVQL